MSKGEQVRARKRQRAANIHPWFYNRSRRPSEFNLQGRRSHPKHEGAKPNLNPETLTRQQVRAMLREKAKRDIITQYGRKGECSGGLTFIGFERGDRRLAVLRMSHRWYKQIVEESKNNPEFGRKRGFIKDVMRKMFGAKENTLAASGVGA